MNGLRFTTRDRRIMRRELRYFAKEIEREGDIESARKLRKWARNG